MASLTLKRGIWYGVFTQNYRQKWVRIGKISKTGAKEILKKLEETTQRKRFGVFDEKMVLLKDYADEYLEFSRTNKAWQSFRRDRTSLNNLLPYFKSIYLPRITAQQIEKYKTKRLDDNVSPRTVNIELRCLSHMLNKAVDWDYLRASPFVGVKLLKHEKGPVRFLSKEEATKLINAASPWLNPIIIFMLNTGVREGERRNLKFEDIDFDNKTITIIKSKAKTFRVIPMNEEVEEVLQFLKVNYVTPYLTSHESYLRKEHQKEFVFCNEDGGSVQSIKRAFSNACKNAGLKGVSPHTLRHTFASHLVMSGVDLRTVQGLLGHKNIATTMVYSHLSEEHLARSVEKLSWQN